MPIELQTAERAPAGTGERRPGALVRAAATVGEAVIGGVVAFGDASRLLVRNLFRIVTFRFKAGRVVDGLYTYGWRSVGIVAVAALFVGMGMALQVEVELRRFGASQNIANVVAVGIIRELGPVLTALILAGRAGSGIAAEVGSMKITEQLAAMRMLGLDVDRHFIAPLLLSVTLSTFYLTVVFDIVGVAGGYVIAVYDLGIPFRTYHELTKDILRRSDVITGLAKSLVFGLIIAWVGAYCGLATRGGGKGLGEHTKRAVVASSFAVLVSNFFLTKLLISVLE